LLLVKSSVGVGKIARQTDQSELAPFPDMELRSILQDIPYPRWVFTAADTSHAESCLRKLGIMDMFRGIISMRSQDMLKRVGEGVHKHDEKSLLAAMEVAGVRRENTSGCVFLDDLTANLKGAKALGWRTIRVGHTKKAEGGADVTIARVHDVQWAVPELLGPFRHHIDIPMASLAQVVADIKQPEEAALVCVSDSKLRNKRLLEPKEGSPPPKRCIRRVATP